MSRAQISSVIFGASLLIILGLNLFDTPLSSTPQVSTTLLRTQLVQLYLTLKASEIADDKRLKQALEKQWDRCREDASLCEAVTLLLWLDGAQSQARKLISTLPDDQALQPLRYAMNLTDQLPDDWASMLSEDWIGAKIATMAYKRMDDQAGLANSLLRVRYYENLNRRNRSFATWLWMLNLIGMGLLISMWFSARQWARLGEKFFKLKPIQVPLPTTFRFIGLFLLSYVLLDRLVVTLFSGQENFLLQMIFFPLQLIVGILLLKYQVFQGSGKSITGALALRNLKMRFVNLFQILGGLAMLIFLMDVGQTLAIAFRWPMDNRDFNAEINEIFQSPLQGAVFFFMAVLLAPVFEEIIFRGMILRGLLARFKPSTAICLSAFFFCILHPLTDWPQIFLMGIGLGLVYNRTANLVVNIWAHAAYNLISILLVLANFF